jgi:hypothetical protein
MIPLGTRIGVRAVKAEEIHALIVKIGPTPAHALANDLLNLYSLPGMRNCLEVGLLLSIARHDPEAKRHCQTID